MQSVGIDIGSSAVKACVFEFDTQPRLIDCRSLPCPLLRPQPGRVLHNLAKLEHHLPALLDQIPSGSDVGFACAMHGLVLLDAQGAPLDDCLSWADTRSAHQATRLWQQDPQAHLRTGTPIHPMAWPSKLLWLVECRTHLWHQVARVTDLKSYLLEKLTGEILPLDLSSASATGLWNSAQRCWDEMLLKRLCVPAAILPEVAEQPYVFDWKGHRLFLGGGDGPLANLGVGAVSQDRIALSLGTSGAVRQLEVASTPLESTLFRYAVDQNHWVRGGAISNGASVLDWLRKQRDDSVEGILRRAESVAVGADGLRVYPYFSGERAPFWRPDTNSHISGWTFEHDFGHLARATIEGVAFCLKRLLSYLVPSNEPLRCTGGLFASPFWRRLLADVLGTPIAVSPVAEATALGAALLTTPSYWEVSREIFPGTVTEPEQHSTQVYSEVYEEWFSREPHQLS